jgi:hypothetical protein
VCDTHIYPSTYNCLLNSMCRLSEFLTLCAYAHYTCGVLCMWFCAPAIGFNGNDNAKAGMFSETVGLHICDCVQLLVCISSSSLFFFLGGIEVWTQGLTFARQALYHLSHSPCPFGDGVFVNYLPRVVLKLEILPISASQVASITGVSHQWQLL